MEFHKYPKIKRLGHEDVVDIFANDEDVIVVQEKMDGANFRFMVDKNGELIFGSRNTELVSDGDHNYQKNFQRTIEYVQDKLKDKDISDYKGYIFFGEAMHKHTLPYNWDEIPPFIGYDIYNGGFLTDGEVADIFKKLQLPIVPLAIEPMKAKYLREMSTEQIEDLVPVTEYAPKGKPDLLAEGVMFKNQENGMMAKYVRDEFKEANAAVFGNDTVKYNGNDAAARLTQKFCPNARIDKHIFKLVDEGHKLEMPMMEHLPNNVWRDIWEEEWQTIVFEEANRDTIDMHKFRKLVTKRCCAVLKQVITNNALQSGVEQDE